MSEAPGQEDAEIDVVSEVLGAVRLTTDVLGRFELGAPWAFRSDRGGAVALYVMASGSATLELLEKTRGMPSVFAPSAGDVAVLPHGAPHLLRDPGAGPRRALTSADLACRRGMQPGPTRFGGSGPVTSFVAGAFHFGAAPRSVLREPRHHHGTSRSGRGTLRENHLDGRRRLRRHGHSARHEMQHARQRLEQHAPRRGAEVKRTRDEAGHRTTATETCGPGLHTTAASQVDGSQRSVRTCAS